MPVPISLGGRKEFGGPGRMRCVVSIGKEADNGTWKNYAAFGMEKVMDIANHL
jgi:hypothetical protein